MTSTYAALSTLAEDIIRQHQQCEIDKAYQELSDAMEAAAYAGEKVDHYSGETVHGELEVQGYLLLAKCDARRAAAWVGICHAKYEEAKAA